MVTQGFFRAKVSYMGTSVLADVYVIDDLGQTLLDGNTCEQLGLVKRQMDLVDEVKTSDICQMSFDPKEKFPALFKGLGKVKIPYKIRLKPDAVPYALTTPRRIPIPMLDEIKANLSNMVQMDVIESVEKPTDWCAGLVLIPKPNGSIRMCVDYVRLNQYVKREIFPMPSTENVLGCLSNAKYFSKMDANHGFWQCELDKDSQLLTTFITPFGRYKFKRLPFGINAAPEFFQKRMIQILEGLDGVVVNIDDILVYGSSIAEHDARLLKVLERLMEARVTLNHEKCVFGVTKVKFLGHVVDANGVHIDSDRIDAILKMEKPENVSELRSLLGSINYLGRFIPHLAKKAHPLNELLKAENDFRWGESQIAAFESLKTEIAKEPVLAWFNPKSETVITADASSYGVGAVLKQRQANGKFRPVAYASKTLTQHQRNWAQIEKEGYALVWACDRFKNFITGLMVVLETDHKPLVAIFSSKELDDITPKLQRMRLRLARYSYTIRHVSGKEIGVADILSRRPLPNALDDDDLEQQILSYVRMVTERLPASDQRLAQIINAQNDDQICAHLMTFSKRGWPAQSELSAQLKTYWPARSEIAMEEGLLMKGSCIIIPDEMRKEILAKLHEGHQGITKCRARARQSVWWPGISNDIETLIKGCPDCIKESSNPHEPLLPSEFPKRPWQKLGMDLFYHQGHWYLLVIDYFSRYPEIARLNSLREAEVIVHLKSIFSRHGIPEIVYSDRGTHFGPLPKSEFSRFAQDWGFVHIMSSAKYPQSNGFAESGVKTIKRCLKKSADGYLAIQSYRATPLSNGYSPAELLMGRKLRTTVPVSSSSLAPKLPNGKILRENENARRLQQKLCYDRHHRARCLHPLSVGEKVWIVDLRREGIVKEKAQQPRSYILVSGGQLITRNRFHLIPMKAEEDSSTADIWNDEEMPMIPATGETERGMEANEPVSEAQRQEEPVLDPSPPDHTHQRPLQQTTRSGRLVKPVQRFTFEVT